MADKAAELKDAAEDKVAEVKDSLSEAKDVMSSKVEAAKMQQ